MNKTSYDSIFKALSKKNIFKNKTNNPLVYFQEMFVRLDTATPVSIILTGTGLN